MSQAIANRTPAAAGRRPVDVEDLMGLRFIDEARLSPDGGCAAAVVQAFDVTANKVVSRIHLVDVTGGTSTPIGGEGSDAQVAWSKDSRRLAFISQRPSGPVLVAHDRSDGTEAVLISGLRGLAAPRWSPDGTRIAFLAYGPDTFGTPEPEKLDPGYRVDRRREPPEMQGLFETATGWARKVWLVDARDGMRKQLTEGAFDDGDAGTGGDLEWSPDGSALVFAGDRSSSWREHDRTSVLYRLDLATGKIEPLTSERGRAMRPSFSRDGREIAYYGGEPTGDLELSYLGLQLLDLRTRTTKGVSAATDRALGTAHNGEPDLPAIWTEAGLVTTFCHEGTVNLMSFGRDGSLTPVTRGAHVVQHASADAYGRRVIAVRSTSTSPSELVVIEKGELRAVFAPNSDWISRITILKPLMRWTRRGDVDLQYWVLAPEKSDRLPVVLDIHGGPDSQYSETFYFDHMLWAARGYAVVYGNPRGSTGYSPKFLNGVVRDWGGEDAKDVLAILDDALAQDPRLDGERVAVTGYSYGGYMTHRLIGITDRFKAAASGCGPTDLISKLGTSDLGRWFERVHYGASPNEKLDWYLDRSPVFAAARIKTPLLMYYGEADQRVPPSQGDEMLYALSRAGTEVELIRFPGENHGVARPIGIGNGTPAHQRAVREAVVGWFDRHLGRSS
ncbi:MAG TPA: S9 family peptidase [Vicinamibacterales bacterium]|jgi:dipeptidyl aminopeptidase/acylaminoacyl peptidase|nr:S9 family peptidase [Vicinamibacterales bacterium]